MTSATRKSGRTRATVFQLVRQIVCLLVVLVSLQAAFVATPAGAAGERSARLSFFYVPPNDGTTVGTIADRTDFIILNADKQSYHQQLLDHGFQGNVIQYLLAAEVEGPGPYRNSSSSCNSSYQGLKNNVADQRGDFCNHIHSNESWFLHNGNGDRLYSTRGSRVYYHMNPASSGWRQFARSRMENHLQANGFDGIFLDNVSLSITKVQKQLTNSNNVVQEFSSSSSYRSAWTGYLSYLSNRLRTNGNLLWANLIADPNDGTNWDAYMTHLDGGMNEAWATGYSSNGLAADKWENNLQQADRTINAGKGFLALGQGSRSDSARQRFHLASYLLIDQPDRPVFLRYGKDGDYDEFWWYSNYDLELGAPLGPRYQEGSSWKRDFQCGSVSVNPSTRSANISSSSCSGGGGTNPSFSVTGLADNQTVSGSIDVEAIVSSSSVDNVRFYLDGGFVWQEGTAPYFLGGDSNGNPDGFNTANWSDGAHTLRVVVRFDNGSSSSLEIPFTVDNGPGTTITGLASGQTVGGSIFVEVDPATSSVDNVRFYLDGQFVWQEGKAPYFLGGDQSGTPNGFDTRSWIDGAHTLRVDVRSSNGSTTSTQIPFTVDNGSGISISGLGNNQTVSGTIDVEVQVDSSSIDRVRFYLDGQFVWQEGKSPYFLGGDSNGVPNGFDTRAWSNGAHVLAVTVTENNGTTETRTIGFQVQN